ncbi:hypothetical protein HK098_000202 [Nowakowskiella sp. JEL0407]|nr:hypothetical protein HK098_000202 [Nowakowskiella sp. JEL0407]
MNRIASPNFRGISSTQTLCKFILSRTRPPRNNLSLPLPQNVVPTRNKSVFSMSNIYWKSKSSISTSPKQFSPTTVNYTSSDSTDRTDSKEKAKTTGFKHLMKTYGPAAFITYSCISFVSYSSWVAAISLGLDVSFIVEYFASIKSYLFGIAVEDVAMADPKEVSSYAKFGTTLLVAVAAHKMIMPIRVALTGYLTPWMSRMLKLYNLEFWKKWNAKP